MAMNFLKDWIIQYQNKFSVGGTETTIERITGTVSQKGDTISAAYLNEIQKNCIYQVNATRVIEGVLEIYDISIDGSEDFKPFNQTFLIDFDYTNTQVDSKLRFNGSSYLIRFSDSISNGDKAPVIGFIPKRAIVKLDVTNSKAIIIDDRTIIQSLLDLKANLSSPALTGTPTAPTGTTGTSNTQIATQENVLNNISSHKQTAKAWVNFNGTGTIAIRSSYNVSSIKDNGIGDYFVNFINPMVDLNFVTVASLEYGYSAITNIFNDVSKNYVRVAAWGTTGNFIDGVYFKVLIFGN